MNIFMLLIVFLAGIATVLSPMIWLMLPLVLASSLEGDRGRPLGVISGLVMALSVWTLNSQAFAGWLGINVTHLNYAPLAILTLLGASLLSDKAQYVLQRWLRPSFFSGYGGGVCLGLCIGMVWTPYGHAILALPWLSLLRQQDNVSAVRFLLAFALGVAVPMLSVAFIARWGLMTTCFGQRYAYGMRRLLGVWVLLTIPLLAGNADVAWWPNPYQQRLSTFAKQQLYGFDKPYAAPALATSMIWLNTPRALSLAALKGKVVLVDFWTYSCINCVRTLPYLNAWYDKYHDRGLEIIGVHSPEFDFEKNPHNVSQAIQRYHIPYPVALDNQLDTWHNFANQYWPAHYLIDRDGNIVYRHVGEGQYAVLENNIRLLLGLGVADKLTSATPVPTQQTPETYLGYSRATTLSNALTPDRSVMYHLPSYLARHHWALAGNWKVEAQRIVAQGTLSQLRLSFKAQKVYAVLGTQTGIPIAVQVRLNGKIFTAANDVTQGELLVDQHRLYQLVDQPQTLAGMLDIIVTKPGLVAYAFTFG